MIKYLIDLLKVQYMFYFFETSITFLSNKTCKTAVLVIKNIIMENHGKQI